MIRQIADGLQKSRACRLKVRERTRSRQEGWESFPSKSFAADGAGSKHGDR